MTQMNEKDKEKAYKLRGKIFSLKKKRNDIHKEVRAYKSRRDEANNIVANLITKSQELKVKRNTANKQVKLLKRARDQTVQMMRQAKSNRNRNAVVSTAQEQEKLHKKVKKAAMDAQKVHWEMEEIAKKINTHRKLSAKAHSQMLEQKDLADKYHQKSENLAMEFNEMKLKYGVDFIEFNIDDTGKMNITTVGGEEE